MKQYETIVEEMIKDWMDNLKPELAEKVIWQISDEMKKSGEGIIRASINTNFSPAVITFYLKHIAITHLMHATEDIKQLIRHEMAHLFTKTSEEDVSSREVNWNIFKE